MAHASRARGRHVPSVFCPRTEHGASRGGMVRCLCFDAVRHFVLAFNRRMVLFRADDCRARQLRRQGCDLHSLHYGRIYVRYCSNSFCVRRVWSSGRKMVPMFVIAGPWLFLSVVLCVDGSGSRNLDLSNQVGCAGLVFIGGLVATLICIALKIDGIAYHPGGLGVLGHMGI